MNKPFRLVAKDTAAFLRRNIGSNPVRVSNIRSIVSAMLLSFFAATASAENSIKSISGKTQPDLDLVRIELAEPATTDMLSGFALYNTSQVVIDLLGTKTTSKQLNVSSGNIVSVQIKQVVDKTRLIINLKRAASYRMRFSGNTVIVALDELPSFTSLSPQSQLDLITSARAAIASSNYDDAIQSLNAFLMLSPNEYTQEGQELIGIAYEKSGQLEKAKIESTVYLSMYPDSEATKRVKERLIALEIRSPAVVQNKLAPRQPRAGTETKIDASASTYYYTGSTGNEPFSWNKEEATQISNLRATGIYKHNEYFVKGVIRYARLRNLVRPDSSKSLLSTGYVDFVDTYRDYDVRLGRQSAIYGTLGRFDGAILGYTYDDAYKFKVLFGKPYTGKTNTKRNFTGAVADLTLSPSSSVLLYVNRSTADGLLERNAIGSEVRYFNGKWSGSLLAEYDTVYRNLSSTMLQGTYRTEADSIFFLLDRRKSPVLFADSALVLGINSINRVPYETIKELTTQSGYTNSDIYNFIESSTPTSTLYMIGATKKISKNVSGSVDFQVTNISSTSDPLFVPTLDTPVSTIKHPGSGNLYILNAAAFGEKVFGSNSSLNGLASFSRDKISSGYSFTILQGYALDDNRIDLLAKYMRRNQEFLVTSSTSVSARYILKIDIHNSFETQVSLVYSLSDDIYTRTRTEKYTQNFYAGWRFDL